ncbi:MAG: endolytic transglycosylase MltG [Patescibacteria group bacterium]
MFKRCLHWCLVFLALGLIALVILLSQLSRYFWQNPDKNAEEQVFMIQEGQSFAAVAESLSEQNLIGSAAGFRVMAEFSGLTDNLQVGSYTLLPGESYKKILAKLTAGTTEADIKVTIPEGYTLKQMAEVLVAKGLVTTEDWVTVTGQFSPLESHEFVVAAGKPDDVDLEGYLFPDTYRFALDATAEDIATVMLDTMARRVNAVGQPRGDAANLNLHEVLTLASIVEREVRQPSTMKNVADIFLKRLDIGMALQADSTVNYVTGGDSPSITLDERDNTDSPYNTYKYPGLPPGPISAPSANAIEAVLDPIHNEYFYFLTTDNGEIYYAESHDEHVSNKARYLR